MSGKGSNPRPFSVPKEQFDSNWEQIFGRKEQKQDRTDDNLKKQRDNNDESTD